MKNYLLIFVSYLLYACQGLAQQPTGYWEGVILHQEREWKIALEFEKSDQMETIALIDFVEIGGYRRQFSVSRNGAELYLERIQPNGRPTLKFKGVLTAKSFSGTFDGIGIEDAAFRLLPARKVAFTSEDVAFRNGSVVLAGTLLQPADRSPCPAVVITHGSGPDTRMLYYGIAMDFVKNGVAALIYDKRGNGQSTGGDYREAGFTDLAGDALAGVAFLGMRSGIQKDQIGVFGHSQGGWIAPMAAALSSDVAFVITSAASGVTATEQSVYHRANVMREEGFDQASVEKARSLRIKLNKATKTCFTDSVAAKNQIAAVAQELKLIKDEPWFEASALPEVPYPGCPSASVLELLFKEPSEIWAQVKVPVYAVWGKKDIVVPIEKIGVISDALRQAGNSEVSIRVVPDTDHSFLVIPEDTRWDFPRESRGYFADMAIWVNHIFNR